MVGNRIAVGGAVLRPLTDDLVRRGARIVDVGMDVAQREGHVGRRLEAQLGPD